VDEHVIAIGAAAFLERLDDLGVKGVALLNALPANEDGRANSDAYLDWDSFQVFLRDVFALWWRRYRSRFEIRELEALVDAVHGRAHGLCIYAGNCMGRYLTIEPDGRTSACEKYVGNSAYAFGSLHDAGIADLLAGSPRLADAVAVVDRQKAEAAERCDYFRYCQGGCPHDDLNNRRFGGTGNGCCGMRPLIDDILEAVNSKEKSNGLERTSSDTVGVDLGAGCA